MSEDIRTEFRRQFAKQRMDMVLHGLECPCPGCKHRRSLVWTKPDAAEGIRKYSQEVLRGSRKPRSARPMTSRVSERPHKGRHSKETSA